MKKATVNGRWVLWLPDNIAEWDAITGDASLDSGWEACRFRSMQRHLRYGDTFFDVGTEHGWISAIIAREFVGAENMVLFEPGPDMWINIRKIWEYNGLATPRACWDGFVGLDTDSVLVHELGSGDVDLAVVDVLPVVGDWPKCANASKPEVGGMPYGSLLSNSSRATITIDDFIVETKAYPKAINIDVEGAELLVLRGAQNELDDPEGVEHVWVSIHPDLMEAFGHIPEDIFAFMAKRDYGRWQHEHLGTDHEEHHHFWRTS